MENTDKSDNASPPIQQPRNWWWVRFIGYTKRRIDERAAKKQKETPMDRAAKITATATRWIAFFTFVSVAVSFGTFWILKSQLKEMHDGGTDTRNLAEASVQQVKLMRQQLVGTQAAALKFSTGFSAEGFEIGVVNIHDVAAIGTHITIRMTLASLPKGLPLGSPVINEVTVPLIVKDKPFGRQWPVPWPQQEFRGNDWPGKRAVRVDGEYSYEDGFGNKISESFCTVYLPRFKIIMKGESASGEGSVPCEGLESTIRDVQARMKEAAEEKKSPN
jgi:hypothetical protein